MEGILNFLPLRCINPNGITPFKDNSTRALHDVHGVGITWQTRCSIANTQPYHHPEPTNRRSANYQPSSWSHILLGSSNEKDHELLENQMKILNKLEDQVKYMLVEKELEPPALLELINDIDQLGLSYRCRKSIKIALDKLRYVEEATGEVTKNLHDSAFYFRLLRQYGYEVSPDVFEKFRDQNGHFRESFSREVQGMLSLFEASHLAYEGETILNDAKTFTRLHLKDPKKFIGANMLEQIHHAMELPYHHRLRRLESRWRIEAYEKKNKKNPVLLELSKLEFNMAQSTFQNDLQELSRWWKAVGLADKLEFARDRLMESFFWSVGMVPDPQFSKCRLAITKAFTLITVLDDIYDVYGSLNELEQFTEAVARWDLIAMKDLPDYMKLFFLALYNTINELAYDTLKEQGEIIIPHLKKAWADLCKAFLQEAQWYYKKVTPTFDEYIENGWISSSGAVQLVHSYFLVSENISKEAIQCLDNHHDILRWPCTIFRLTNDFSSSKMNKELISSSPSNENFLEITINLARTALCQYQHGDAHSALDDIARNRIFSVIMEPIQ